MKSAMPYLGVAMPDLRRALRPVLATVDIPDATTFDTMIRDLWHQAEYREERYAVLAILRCRKAQRYATDPAVLPLLRDLIVSASWWDLCDELAAHCLGRVLSAHPGHVGPVLRRWSRDSNLWVRRCAILAQLRRKEDTDPDLLEYCLDGSVEDTEFFARKAVGWALREYAKVGSEAADRVRSFVESRGLRGLARREALRHIGEADR